MSAAMLRLLLLNMTIMAYIPYWHNPVKHSTGRRSRFPGPHLSKGAGVLPDPRSSLYVRLS